MNMTAWNNLNMKQRAELMKIYLQNGITSLSEMRDHYNEYAAGGHIYQTGGKEGDDPPLIKPHVSPYSYSNYTSLRDELNNYNVSDKTATKPTVTKTQIVSSIYRNKKKAEERQGVIQQSNKTAKEIRAIPDNSSQRDWSVGNIPIGKYLDNLNNTVQDFDQTFNNSSLGDLGNPFNYIPAYWYIKGSTKLAADDPLGALDIALNQFHQVPAMFNNAKNMYRTASNKVYQNAKNMYQTAANNVHNGVHLFENKTGYTPTEFLKAAVTKNGFDKAKGNASYYSEKYNPSLVIRGDVSDLNPYIHTNNEVVNRFNIESYPYITPEGESIPRHYAKLLEHPSYEVDEEALKNIVYTDMRYLDSWGWHSNPIKKDTPLNTVYVLNSNNTLNTSPIIIPKDSPEYYAYMKKRVNDLQEFADRYNGALAGSTKLFWENPQIPNDVEFEMTKENAKKFAQDYGRINRELTGVEGINIILTKDVLSKDGRVLIPKGSEVDVPFIDSKNPKIIRQYNLTMNSEKAVPYYTKQAYEGKSGDIPFYTVDEVLRYYKDGNVQQAVDAFKSKKPKHVIRALAMLFSDDPKVRETAFKALSKMKEEIPNYVDYYIEGMFNDVKSNEEFLKKIMKGIPESEVNRIANNPEHMKLIADKWYYENTVTTGRFNNKEGWSIEESARANSATRDVFGGGRNTTTGTHGGGTGYGDYERVTQVPFSFTRGYKNAMDLYNDYIKTSSRSYDTLVGSTIEQHLHDLGINLPSMSMLKHDITEGRWSNAVAKEMFDAGYTKEQVRNTISDLSKRYDSPGYFPGVYLTDDGKYVGVYIDPENRYVYKDIEGIGFEKNNLLDEYLFKTYDPYSDDYSLSLFNFGSDDNVIATLNVPYKGNPYKHNKKVWFNIDEESLRDLGIKEGKYVDKLIDDLGYNPREVHTRLFKTAKDRKKYETADKLDLLQQLIQNYTPVVGGGLSAWGLYNMSKKNGEKKKEERIRKRKERQNN